MASRTSDLEKYASLLEQNTSFEVLAPFLIKKGIISSHRIDEYQTSKSDQRCRMLVNEVAEQGKSIKHRFLHCLKLGGYDSVLQAFELYFGVRFSSAAATPLNTPIEEKQPVLFDDTADGCCLSRQISSNGEDNVDIAENGIRHPEVRPGEILYMPGKELRIYQMTSRPRGYALVIVNQSFDNNVYGFRKGAEKDRVMLNSLFEGLGFIVYDHWNKTSSEMRSIFRKFSQLDHTLVDSCIVAVSTHGEPRRLVGTDNEYIFMEDVLDIFSNDGCHQLKNKPKLFFVQACRGDKIDFGVPNGPHVSDGGNSVSDALILPTNRSSSWTDMTIAYSTVPEYVSMRNEQDGSWFIQAVTYVFSRYAYNLRLSHLWFKVVDKMLEFEAAQGTKQAPEIVHRGWRKDLFFNPGLYLS